MIFFLTVQEETFKKYIQINYSCTPDSIIATKILKSYKQMMIGELVYATLCINPYLCIR